MHREAHREEASQSLVTPLCVLLFLGGWEEFVDNVCSFSSTWELTACPPFEVQTTTSRPNPHFLLSWGWYRSLNFALSSGPIFSWHPHMYIHDKLGYFLLLICVMSIWLLDQPRELQIEKRGHFPLPHHYIKRYSCVNSYQCDSCYLNRKDFKTFK